MNDKRVIVKGSRNHIIETLCIECGFEEDDMIKILNFIEEEKNVLCEDEEYKITYSGFNGNSNMLGLMIMDNSYYINIRVLTIFVISSLLDTKIGCPITAGYLTARGMNRMIEKINSDSGMKCILLEILRSPNKTGTIDILKRFKRECCNNDLCCTFRSENKCKCEVKDIETLMDQMVDMGVLKKEANYYKYDLFGSV